LIWVMALINFLHLSSTVTWIGSIVFITLILFPILKRLTEEYSSTVFKIIFSVFRKITVVSIIIIIISGILIAARLSDVELTLYSTYGIIFLLKHLFMLVILAMVLIANYYFFPKIHKFCQLKKENELCSYQKQLIGIMSASMVLGLVTLALTAFMQFL